MVSIVLIGDEILSAEVQERNLYPLLSGFGRIGYEVREVRIVPDTIAAIAGAVRDLWARSEYLITAGGVGPTHDDITLEALAVAFSVPLEEDPVMTAFLKERYQDRFSPTVAKMALLPQGSEVLGCDQGWWPLIRRGNLFVLPGLPRALEDKIERLLALLPPRDRLWTAEIFLRADESLFARWLAARQSHCPAVTIGSYPVAENQDYRVRLVLRGLLRDDVLKEAREIACWMQQQGWLVRTGGSVGEIMVDGLADGI
ncbi:molybdenum cofactor synthesis domain-containing protein [Alkalispirochaeta americana]|uniref:Molybdenum cofactor synthesis domain-containing protein n=1 Tax=Alkalispirochaeta americana TaxID=159291 RepID=A0A1N6SC55_9SPIO|nr:molybdopterin-binding protein [Alkalispirochaeta americana]SIQ38735.1 molybdenum cofactor synthesis domain-containing protein [Alkalispirochaeta americana]